MKKLPFLSLIAVFMSLFGGTSLFGQKAYVSFTGGYGMSMSSQNLYNLGFYNYTSDNNSFTEEQVYVSLGKGLNFGGALGYMFTKNISAELGFSYLMGGKSYAKDTYTDGITENTISANMFRIMPSVVIFSGMEGINPYARFGMVIGTASTVFDVNSNVDNEIFDGRLVMNGGLAIGLNAGVGALYKLSDKISLFGELNMINLSHAPTKGEITKLNMNGTNLLPDMTTNEREIEFVDVVTIDYDTPTSDSEPNQALKQKLPFGSIGFNIGLRIDL
ncbi:MAG: porin family protein [Schleiferiaceae bacterium]|nr:porin family protein [Schleiferiaceae bacterium]